MFLQRLCGGVVALFALTASLLAQNVSDVTVRFLNEYAGDPSDILTRCVVKPGIKVSQEDISTDTKTLLASGQYSSVTSEVETLPNNTVRVTYNILRRYTLVAAPTIVSNKVVSAAKIQDWLKLKSGDYVDDAIVFTSCAKVRDEYYKRFYPDAQVTFSLTPVDKAYGTASLSLTISEGFRRVYSEFAFDGNKVFSSDDLAANFNQYDWYDPRGWFSDTPYNETKLEAARIQALDLYLNAGYLDATITGPEFVPLTGSKTRVLYHVDEGVRYTVASVSVEGATLFPTNNLVEAASLKSGVPAGRETIDAATKRVRDFYTSRGYIDVALRPVVESSDDGLAKIRLLVRDENLRQVTVRNIKIQGNRATQEKIIRREISLSVAPGDILDTTAIERSENRLKNLNYFKDVHAYLAQVPGSDTEREIVYDVIEKSTGSFMVGIGFSSIDSVIGFAEISQSNFDITNWKTFTGAGQKARASVEVGTDSETFLVSWTEPWFLDRPLELTTDLYRRQRSYDEYDDVRTGGGIGLSYPVAFRNVNIGRLGYRLTLEEVQMKDVDRDIYYYDNGRPYFYTEEDDSYFRAALRVYLGNDTRNRIFIPTRGRQWQIWAETGFGNEATYAFGANGRQWIEMPLKGHVLSLRGRIDTIDTWNGDTPTITERLFLGGGRTVRGVAFRSLGPKVNRYGAGSWHPVGGQTLTFASAEYTIPLVKAVRLGIFTDFGSLNEDSFSPDFSDYMVTAGAGLRIDIPGFPIRLDFAAPVINNDDNADKEFFSFWIGFE